MATRKLWNIVEELKTPRYKWMELSHPVSPETPHWVGFKPMTAVEKALDFHEDGFDVVAYGYYIVSQYGTHIDCPAHFVPDGRTLEKMPIDNLLFPLCVIDVSSKVNEDNDYALTVEDIQDYESKYGRIPDNAFVAMRSDWSITHASDYENNDVDGNPTIPDGHWKRCNFWWRNERLALSDMSLRIRILRRSVLAGLASVTSCSRINFRSKS